MRLFIYLVQLAESTNLTLFSDLLSPSSGNNNKNNKTAAERRQMFLIGSLLARGRNRGQGAEGGVGFEASSKFF